MDLSNNRIHHLDMYKDILTLCPNIQVLNLSCNQVSFAIVFYMMSNVLIALQWEAFTIFMDKIDCASIRKNICWMK